MLANGFEEVEADSLFLLYIGWSVVMIMRFWYMWYKKSMKRFITVVSVSLSSAGDWRMGSVSVVVRGEGGDNGTGGFVHCS